jgi:glucosyl-dolichyl phosphate glucuronosyltransferase
MMGVSIVIPTYNRAEYLRGTLASLSELNVPQGVDVEVLVIDNNCTDDTANVAASAARSLPFPVRHVVETQQGLCFGRNRGIAEARHEHLAYLDDEIRVSPDWLTGYLEAIDGHSADAVVGPVFPLLPADHPDYLKGQVLEGISSSYSRRGDHILILPADTAHELPGCNFGVRKAVAVEIGRFDTTLDRVGEGLIAGGDFEFGRRLVRAGKRTVYHPACSIEHIMIPTKLTKEYLRRRAYATGITRRRMSGRGTQTWSVVRGLLGAGRIFTQALGHRLRRDRQRAFELELHALESAGYFFGR